MYKKQIIFAVLLLLLSSTFLFAQEFLNEFAGVPQNPQLLSPKTAFAPSKTALQIQFDFNNGTTEKWFLPWGDSVYVIEPGKSPYFTFGYQPFTIRHNGKINYPNSYNPNGNSTDALIILSFAAKMSVPFPIQEVFCP